MLKSLIRSRVVLVLQHWIHCERKPVSISYIPILVSHVLSQYFQDPIPSNPYKCYDWLRKIMKQYKELDHYLFLHQGKYVKYKKIAGKFKV